MANYVYIAQSLDGYIATRDGGIEWLNQTPEPSQAESYFADFMSNIDAVGHGAQHV